MPATQMLVEPRPVAGEVRTLEAEVHLPLLCARTNAARSKELAFFFAAPATRTLRQMGQDCPEFRVTGEDGVVEQLHKPGGIPPKLPKAACNRLLSR